MPGVSWELILNELQKEVNNELVRLNNLVYSEERDLKIALTEAKQSSLKSALGILEQAQSENSLKE